MTTETYSIDGAIPDGQHRAERGDSGAQPATAVRVVLLGVALLGVLGALAFLVMPRGGAIELQEVQAELFADVRDPLPFQLTPDGARRLPSFERVLTYTRDAELGGSVPVELTIIEYPASKAEEVLKDQFNKLRFDTGRGGPGGGRSRGGRGGRGGGRHGGGRDGDFGSMGPTLRDAGYLDWHGYRANYARLRHTPPKPKGAPQEGREPAAGSSSEPAEDPGDASTSDAGTSENRVAVAEAFADRPADAGVDKKRKPGPFYETVRVNLSTGGRCVIAYVRFPENVVGSKEAVETIVASFRPVSE